MLVLNLPNSAVVADMISEKGPVPTEFLAATLISYVVPGTRLDSIKTVEP